MAAYLFAHFIGDENNGEQIYFSVSRDGLHWKDLNNGNPVLISRIGTCGARDPFLVRSPETGIIYLIATDLRIEAGLGWKNAQEKGSKNICACFYINILFFKMHLFVLLSISLDHTGLWAYVRRVAFSVNYCMMFQNTVSHPNPRQVVLSCMKMYGNNEVAYKPAGNILHAFCFQPCLHSCSDISK